MAEQELDALAQDGERGGSCLHDTLIAAVLFAGAAVFGMTYVSTWGDYGRFYQPEYGPAVMLALGRGFVNPAAEDAPALSEFLKGDVDRLDPLDFPPEIPTKPLSRLQRGWRYQLHCVGWLWRLFGISWTALSPLYGLFYGLTTVAVFGIFRLAMNRVIATAGALVILLSPINLYYLPHLRDYSKVPFILLAIFALGYLVKRELRPGLLLAFSAGLGVLVGIGRGFRADVSVCLPAAIVIITVFHPGRSWRRVGAKVVAVVALLGCFFCSAWPLLASANEEARMNHHVAVLGLMERFDYHLGVGGTPYVLGHHYKDYYAYCAVVGSTEPDAGSAGKIPYDSREYDKAGMAYCRNVAKTLPADLVLRVYASVLRILDYGPFISTSVTTKLLEVEFIEKLFLTRWRWFGWLSGLGKYFAVVTIGVLSACSLRYGLATAFCLFYFTGYAALQFDLRHHFHLEFVTWWFMAFCLQHVLGALPGLCRRAGRNRVREIIANPKRWWTPPVHRLVAVAGLLCLGLLAPLYGARAYQYHRFGKLMSRYAGAELERVELEAADVKGGELFRPRDLGRPRSHSDQDKRWRIDTDYLMAEVECVQELPLQLVYRTQNKKDDFSHWLRLRPEQGTEGAVIRFFFPVYQCQLGLPAGANEFMGISVRAADVSHFRGLYRVKNAWEFPLLLTLMLYPNWQQLPRYATLQRSRLPFYPRSSRAARRNLLPNGGFERWTAGVEAPEGFHAPVSCSVIAKEDRCVGEGDAAVRQVWAKSGSGMSIFRKGYVAVAGLKPNTRYELFVKAHTRTRSSVRISAWQVSQRANNTTAVDRLALDLIVPKAGAGFKEYGGWFTTLPGEGFSVLLVTSCKGEELPTSVIWDDWRLTELDCRF